MAIIKKSQTRTQTILQDVVYSDVMENLDIHPGKKDVMVYINEDSIIRSIKNILFTNRGEKLFNPLFGSDIKSTLFEQITPQSEGILKGFIETAINNFEPRAKLLDVLVSASPDENAYEVTIVFTTINRSAPITLELIFNRIR